MKRENLKTNSSCRRIADMAWDYHENEVGLQLKNEIEDHLQNCEECQKVYQQTEAVHREIDKQKNMLAPPFISTGIINQLKNNTRRSLSFSYLLKPAFAALILVLMIITGVYTGSIVAGKIYASDEATETDGTVNLIADQHLFQEADFYTPGFEYLNE